MSAYPPPTYNFANISYNPSFFTQTTIGITQGQANLLYLQKTTADTATALETFSGGIITNKVDVSTTSSTMDIATTSVSGLINIGTASARTGIIHIGDGNNLVAGANMHINNGTTNSSNTQVMNGATTLGTCNIMTGTTSSGIVNIATGTGASQTSAVNIGSGTTTGSVTIGNTANSTLLQGKVTIPNLGTNNYVFRQPTSSQAITSGVDTSVLFNTLLTPINTIGLSYNSTTGVFTNLNASSVTCHISYTVAFFTNSAGLRNTRINSSAFPLVPFAYVTVNATTSTESLLSSAGILNIPNNGTFYISCYQNCGGPLGLDQAFTSIQILVL